MADFGNLSHIDFEDLCRDIAEAEYGVRFSAFGPGPDGGIDGRHSTATGDIILQCKHYHRSSFSDLLKSAKDEAAKIKSLRVNRYIFFTSASLTPKNSEKIAKVLGPALASINDIWGREDIEGALRKHPHIFRSHFKLWLSSTEVIDKIVNARINNYNRITKSEIIETVKVYVRNESFDEATKILEEQKVLIITGPPGVGKTTLADIISYYYIKDDWKFYSIGNIEDAFAVIEENPKTLYYFDDFLGRIKLDKQSLLQNDSAFARFIRSVQRSKNARFVLTSRAHIFEEARQISDYIDDDRLQLSKFLLNVERYTRKVRAYILFNHLSISNLNSDHFSYLLEKDWLEKIIDHRNYNPRAIAQATSELFSDIDPKNFPMSIIDILSNPQKIWDKPFLNLDISSQNLLCAIYFSNEFGVHMGTLREIFGELHRAVSTHHGHATYPSDFEISLRSLESGFISISDQQISFVNPSLRDYLKNKLRDTNHLAILPYVSRRSDWARSLWIHIQDVIEGRHTEISKFAQLFSRFAEIIDKSPYERRKSWGLYSTNVIDDLPVTDRIFLLLDWWRATENRNFIIRAYDYFEASREILNARRDGSNLPILFRQIRDESLMPNDFTDKFCGAIQDELARILADLTEADVLLEIYNNFEGDIHQEELPKIRKMIDTQIGREFDDVYSIAEEMDSESSLADHLSVLESFSDKTGRDIDYARTVIEEKIFRIQQDDWDSDSSPDFSKVIQDHSDIFDDKHIKSLFGNLL